MAWYRTGTISVTNGSTTVTGSGTSWITGAGIGEALYAPDGRIYEIANIASNTSLTLATAYLGANQSGQSYAIIPSQSYIRDLAADASSLISQYAGIASGAGAGKFTDGSAATPGITFSSDVDTGIYRASTNTLGIAAGGVSQMTVNTSGANIPVISNNPTLSSGTANGVLYLNGSKVVSSGSALTFDGTDLQNKNKVISGGVGGSNGYFQLNRTDAANLGSIQWVTSGDEMRYSNNNGGFHSWYISSEQMRLTSTGLGIGTSSPDAKIHTYQTVSTPKVNSIEIGASYAIGNRSHGVGFSINNNPVSAGVYVGDDGSGSTLLFTTSSDFATNPSNTERMRITPSGNLGIGTNSPATKLAVVQSGAGTQTVLDVRNDATTSGVVGTAIKLGYGTGVSGHGSRIVGYADPAAAFAGALAFERGSGVGTYTESMRLDTSGNLGIGTSSPDNKLTISNGSINIFSLQNVADDYRFIGTQYGAGNTNNAAQVRFAIDGADTKTRIAFATSNGAGTLSEKMRLDSAGNLGLGVTPRAWVGNVKATQIGSFAAVWTGSNGSANSGFGAYEGGVNTYNYITTGDSPTMYQQLTGAHKWLTAPSGTAGNPISFTQAMTLDASGNLGVGTTSPTQYSHGGSAKIVEIRNSNTSANSQAHCILSSNSTLANSALGTLSWVMPSISASKLVGYIGMGTDSTHTSASPKTSLQFAVTDGTGPVERARIDSNGNLLVGTTTATSVASGGVIVGPGDISSVNIGHGSSAPSGTIYESFQYNGSTIGSITQNGTTAVAYNTSSDYRLKNITGPVTTSGAYIDSLNPVEGTWKADGSTFVGLIAHEVQEVSRTQVATGEKDGAEMQAMDYSNSELIANLIAEVQSLRKRLAILEAK